MKIKNIVNNQWNCGTLQINNKYHLFIERLDYEEDILVELFDSIKNVFVCNCLEYINHTFTTETTEKELNKCGRDVIKLYEKGDK